MLGLLGLKDALLESEATQRDFFKATERGKKGRRNVREGKDGKAAKGKERRSGEKR